MRVSAPVASLAAFLPLAALFGCERLESWVRDFQGPSSPEGRPAASASASPSESPSGSASPPSADGGTRPARPLDPKVRRSMRLSPQKVHEPGLAIGKGRIAALTEAELVVRDTTKFEEVTRIPLHQARNLATMADGSFLSADAAHTTWLLPHDTKARSFPRIVMLPASTLFADRRTPDRFWVLSGLGSTLYGYDIGQSSLPILVAREWITLDGYDGHAFGSLRDGSFFYSTATGFRQFWGPTRKDDIAGDPRGVFRMLPASRVDTVWLLTPEHADLFRILAGKLTRLRSISFAAMPLDVEADGEYLAVLELLQPSDAPWSMHLEVFDVDGKRHLDEALTTEESFDEKTWLATLLRNRRLALAADPPLVAVGGPDSLTAWNPKKGTRVHPPP